MERPMCERVLTLLLLVGATGCVAVPTARHTPKKAPTRVRVGSPVLERLVVSQATRAEVLAALGEPDGATADERWFVYRWTSIGGYFAWLDPYAPEAGAVALGRKREDIVLAFDAEGRLAYTGALERLVARGVSAAPEPVYSDETLQLRVLQPQPGLGTGYGSARLRVGPAGLSLVSDTAPEQRIEIAPERVKRLSHGSDHKILWTSGWLNYYLDYEDERGRSRELDLQIPLVHLPRLAAHIRARCPNAVVRP
jgi:hypothetical protein